ncbi:MAG: hypothetical protein IPP40_16800 [bacterium]|nr:hypothetical protein [bacterium]
MILRTTCALLLLWSFAAFGLTITEAEYYFNTDPGQGNGIDIPISVGESVNITSLNVPTNLLPNNVSHELYIRYRSDEGFWGNSESRNFFLHQPDPNTFAGRDVTHAEYWFDNLPSTIADISDDPEVVFAALIPTSGLATNLAHKFSIRYLGTNGYVSNTESRYFFLHEPISNVWYGRDITHVEYRFDNLVPVVIDLGNNFEVDYYDLIPVAGLAPNLEHKLSVRYLDEDGKWGNTESRYFFAIQLDNEAVEYIDITHIEYSYDNANPVLVDVTDGQTINYAALIASLGLQVNQAHKLSVRYKDERGLWSNIEARYVFVHESPDGELTLLDVAALEYWIDGGAPLQVDIADAASISFADAVAHNAGPGPHEFRLRYVSEEGQRSNTIKLPFFVWSGAGPSGPAHLAGAEYFLNVDPGVGNGVPVTFAQDGAWDEREENAFAVLTGLPVGLHRFGIRFRDEVGNWSLTLADTFVVGPVLVISVSGSDIVLNWTANPDNIPFHVYRAPGTGGAFAEIGTSNSLSYTDVGIINSSARQDYYITTTNNGVLSRYRLPAANRATK